MSDFFHISHAWFLPRIPQCCMSRLFDPTDGSCYYTMQKRLSLQLPCGMITFWPQCTGSTTPDKKTAAKNAAPASESGEAFGEQTLMLSELSTLQTLLWAEKSWPKTAGQGRVWGKTPSVSGNSFSPFLPLSNQNVSTCKTHSGESWIHKWLIPSLRCFPNMAPESAELLSA